MAPQNIDPIIQLYIDLVKKNTNVFKAFYVGDPIRIPVSMMPCLIVARRMTTTEPYTNTEDIHNIQLVFTVVADIRKDISDETTLTPGNGTLYDIMEGRDPATYQLKPQSLLGILRKNVNVDRAHQIWTDIKSSTRIEYGLLINKRQENSWSIEGAITTQVAVVQTR